MIRDTHKLITNTANVETEISLLLNKNKEESSN